MGKNQIIDGQINIENKYEVNIIEVNKNICFYAMVFTDGKQNINPSKSDISYCFKEFQGMEPFDDIEPVFDIYELDDEGVLFTYGDKKKFNKDMQNVYDGERVVDKTKLILENYTFLYYQFATHKIAIIQNRNVSSWQKGLSILLSSSDFHAEVRPYINKSIYNQLPSMNFSSIEYAISSPNINDEVALFKHLDMANQSAYDFSVCKLNLKLSLEKEKGRIGKLLDNLKLKKFSTFKLTSEDFIYDAIKETVTLTRKIKLPKKLVKGSSNITDLKNKIIEDINKYTKC